MPEFTCPATVIKSAASPRVRTPEPPLTGLIKMLPATVSIFSRPLPDDKERVVPPEILMLELLEAIVAELLDVRVNLFPRTIS